MTEIPKRPDYNDYLTDIDDGRFHIAELEHYQAVAACAVRALREIADHAIKIDSAQHTALSAISYIEASGWRE